MSLNAPIRAIRVAFFAACLGGGYLAFNAATGKFADTSLATYLIVAAILGLLLILVDMLLKGFTLRSLTSLTLGLAIGALISCFIAVSPLLDGSYYTDAPEMASRIFTIKVAVFIASTYLATVITVRSRDEFNLVIPYVRFTPLDTPPNLVVLDSSALIDGRIVGLCTTGFVSAALVLPRFVIEELQSIADSQDLARRARGRRGLANLNALKEVKEIELRIHETGMRAEGTVDDRLIALAISLKAALLTTDYNLAQVARFQGVKWLNLNALGKTMKYEVQVTDVVEVELTREGREPGQAVGNLPDGTLIIVNEGAAHLGKNVAAEVTNITANTSGRMIFAKMRSLA